MCNRRGLATKNEFGMKYRIIFIILFGVLGKPLLAQTNYFIWLQSDQQQYFQVELLGRSYESSQAGYIVIPKMPSGLYELKVYPGGDKKLQYAFNIQIAQEDRGFTLKQREGQLVLMDMFSLQTIQPVNLAQLMANPSDIKKQESSKEISRNEVIVNIDNRQPFKTDTSVLNQKKQSVVEQIMQQTNQTQLGLNSKGPKNASNVIKIYDKRTSQGIDRVYIDYSVDQSDTIIIFISDPEIETNSKNSYSQPPTNKTKSISKYTLYGIIVKKEELWQIS